MGTERFSKVDWKHRGVVFTGIRSLVIESRSPMASVSEEFGFSLPASGASDRRAPNVAKAVALKDPIPGTLTVNGIVSAALASAKEASSTPMGNADLADTKGAENNVGVPDANQFPKPKRKRDRKKKNKDKNISGDGDHEKPPGGGGHANLNGFNSGKGEKNQNGDGPPGGSPSDGGNPQNHVLNLNGKNQEEELPKSPEVCFWERLFNDGSILKADVEVEDVE